MRRVRRGIDVWPVAQEAAGRKLIMKRHIVAIALACAAASAVVTGQMKNTALPRAVDGHPDLTGTYDLAMLTPLERPANMPAVLNDEEAAKLEKQVADQNRALDRA